jgi:hypothetical protein
MSINSCLEKAAQNPFLLLVMPISFKSANSSAVFTTPQHCPE